MLYKARTKSKELLIMELLNTRMNLSSTDKQYYHSLKKGYEGEVLFDALTEKLQCECFILNDLLLNINNTNFQIDSLCQDRLFFPQNRRFKIPQKDLIDPSVFLVGASFPVIDSFPPLG